MVLFEVIDVNADTAAQCVVTTGLNENGEDGYEFINMVEHADKGWTLRPEFGEWPYLIYWTRGQDILEFHEQDVTLREYQDDEAFERALARLPRADTSAYF